MSLAAGTRLGPYEVLGPIGAGGMGEVYQARDTRLDRTVAIKVLPAELSSDPERRARFEREARTIAALNHPHICTLHDIGHHDGTTYLVMEHLTGETLAQRLRKGALPIAQALDIGAQIAEALDAAHKHGIVHRDLKPGNVMLTMSGTGRSGIASVKLLDFGLAKLREPEVRAVTNVSEPTATEPLTRAGEVLGTRPYMAPEQVEGKATDARTDLWALGCVLYEMVTGRPAFTGDSVASITAAILEREPEPLATRQPLTPPALDHVVRKCLAKAPEARWQSARDVADVLRWASEGSGVATTPQPAPRSPRWRRWTITAVLVCAAAAAGAATVALRRTGDTAPGRTVRFSISLPAGRLAWGPALSPDASHLAYVGVDGERQQVFVRALDQMTDRPVAGSDDASWPFFSPDGQSLGFFVGTKLKRVPVAGGEAVTVCDLPRGGPDGAVWTDDDTIVVGAVGTGLWRVPASGGVPVALTTIDRAAGERGHVQPAQPAGRRSVLFTTIGGMTTDAIKIEAVPIDGGARRTVVTNARWARSLPNGFLAFAGARGLMVAQFDASQPGLRGDPVLAVENVRGQYAVSRSGDLVYVPPPSERPFRVVRVDTRGRTEPLATVSMISQESIISLAPDGRRLLITRMGFEYSLDVLDIQRGVVTRVAADGNPHAGVWSPDGEQIIFSANLSGASNANLFRSKADGSGTPERLVTSPQHQDPGSWSRDGRWVAYAELDPEQGCSLWKLDMTTGRATPFRRARASERYPAISPDGRWLAYSSNESGREEVYLEAFPAGGKRVQASSDGGREPVWAADGRRLFYRADSRLMSVAIASDTTPSVGAPAAMFEDTFVSGVAIGPVGYAVAPDGQHFYFLQASDGAPALGPPNVVLGWHREIGTRLAAK